MKGAKMKVTAKYGEFNFEKGLDYGEFIFEKEESDTSFLKGLKIEKNKMTLTSSCFNELELLFRKIKAAREISSSFSFIG